MLRHLQLLRLPATPRQPVTQRLLGNPQIASRGGNGLVLLQHQPTGLILERLAVLLAFPLHGEHSFQPDTLPGPSPCPPFVGKPTSRHLRDLRVFAVAVLNRLLRSRPLMPSQPALRDTALPSAQPSHSSPAAKCRSAGRRLCRTGSRSRGSSGPGASRTRPCGTAGSGPTSSRTSA